MIYWDVFCPSIFGIECAKYVRKYKFICNSYELSTYLSTTIRTLIHSFIRLIHKYSNTIQAQVYQVYAIQLLYPTKILCYNITSVYITSRHIQKPINLPCYKVYALLANRVRITSIKEHTL